MSGAAFLFPGQGSQSVGMGKALAERYPVAGELFRRADEVLGWKLSEIAWNGPDEELLRTDRTQPAIYVASAASCAVLRERGIEPTMAAGHSVGEYAALYAAGVFGFEEGLGLVKARSEAMHEASRAHPGGMIALLGMEEAAARAACEDVLREGQGVVEVANLNSPGQIVISGATTALDLAMRLSRMRGAVKAVPLAVAGAWHCSLMKSAEEALAPAIESASFLPPRIPVFPNVTGRDVEDPGELKRLLIRQVCGAVRWADSMTNMIAKGATRFIEVGHGRVLGGLMKRIDRKAKVEPAGIPDEIEALEL